VLWPCGAGGGGRQAMPGGRQGGPLAALRECGRGGAAGWEGGAGRGKARGATAGSSRLASAPCTGRRIGSFGGGAQTAYSRQLTAARDPPPLQPPTPLRPHRPHTRGHHPRRCRCPSTPPARPRC
jgi:hypothetical protein